MDDSSDDDDDDRFLDEVLKTVLDDAAEREEEAKRRRVFEVDIGNSNLRVQCENTGHLIEALGTAEVATIRMNARRAIISAASEAAVESLTEPRAELAFLQWTEPSSRQDSVQDNHNTTPPAANPFYVTAPTLPSLDCAYELPTQQRNPVYISAEDLDDIGLEHSRAEDVWLERAASESREALLVRNIAQREYELTRLQQRLKEHTATGNHGAAIREAISVEADPSSDLGRQIQKSIGAALVSRRDGTLIPRRIYEVEEKAFYGLLLCIGGAAAVTVVATFLLGFDNVRTVLKWRQDAPRLLPGTSASAIKSNLRDVVIPLLTSYGLGEAMMMISEDGTGLQSRLDCVVTVVDSRQVITIHGLSCGPVIISGLQEIVDLITEHGLATTAYVFMLQPLVVGAPSIPLAIETHDNTFTAEDANSKKSLILKAFADNGLGGRVILDAHDGDPKLRSLLFKVHFHRGDVASRYLGIDHGFIQLRIPWIEGYGYFSQFPDYMHILWRLRIILLSSNRKLQCGGIEMDGEHLVNFKETCVSNIRAQDVEPKNKQNWGGVLRMAGLGDDGKPNSTIIEDMKQTATWSGTALYLTFMRNYAQIFISGLPMWKKVEKCGWVLAFVAEWRRQISSPRSKLTMKDNFLTTPTYLDVVTSVMLFVLVVKLVRDKRCEAAADGTGRLDGAPLQPETKSHILPTSMISSKISEFNFASMRRSHSNATHFSALGALEVQNHIVFQTDSEQKLGSFAPTGKRLAGRGAGKISWNEGSEDLSKLSDVIIKKQLESGAQTFLSDLDSVRALNPRESSTDLPSISAARLARIPLLSPCHLKTATRSDLTAGACAQTEEAEIRGAAQPGSSSLSAEDDEKDKEEDDDDVDDDDGDDDDDEIENGDGSGEYLDRRGLPKSQAGLQKIGSSLGLSTAGISDAELRHLITAKRREEITNAGCSEDDPEPTKKEVRRAELESIARRVAGLEKDDTAHENSEVLVVRAFCRKVNSHIGRVSRERTGKRHRFMDQELWGTGVGTGHESDPRGIGVLLDGLEARRFTENDDAGATTYIFFDWEWDHRFEDYSVLYYVYAQHGLICPPVGHEDLNYSLWGAQLEGNITISDNEPIGQITRSKLAAEARTVTTGSSGLFVQGTVCQHEVQHNSHLTQLPMPLPRQEAQHVSLGAPSSMGAALPSQLPTSSSFAPSLQLQPAGLNIETADVVSAPRKDPLVDPTEVDLVLRALTCRSRREIVLEVPCRRRGGVVVVTAEQFGRLSTGRWLNDNIVEAECIRLEQLYKDCLLLSPFFMTQLCCAEEATGQFVKYDYSKVRRWVCPGLLKHRLLCFPLNKGRSHWTSIVVDVPKRQVWYYDPLNHESQEHVDAVVRFLIDFETGHDLGPALNWNVDYLATSFPSQRDSYNCGVFMLKCFHYRCAALTLTNRSFDSDADMDSFRTRIALDLIRAFGSGVFASNS